MQLRVNIRMRLNLRPAWPEQERPEEAKNFFRALLFISRIITFAKSFFKAMQLFLYYKCLLSIIPMQ